MAQSVVCSGRQKGLPYLGLKTSALSFAFFTSQLCFPQSLSLPWGWEYDGWSPYSLQRPKQPSSGHLGSPPYCPRLLAFDHIKGVRLSEKALSHSCPLD